MKSVLCPENACGSKSASSSSKIARSALSVNSTRWVDVLQKASGRTACQQKETRIPARLFLLASRSPARFSGQQGFSLVLGYFVEYLGVDRAHLAGDALPAIGQDGEAG